MLINIRLLLVFPTVRPTASFGASLHLFVVGLLPPSSDCATVAAYRDSTHATQLLETAAPHFPPPTLSSLSTARPNGTNFFTIKHPVAILMHFVLTLTWYDFW